MAFNWSRISYPPDLIPLLRVEQELRPYSVNYRALAFACALIAHQFWNPAKTIHCSDSLLAQWTGPACASTLSRTYEALTAVLPLSASHQRALRVALEALSFTPLGAHALRRWLIKFNDRSQRLLHHPRATNLESATRLLFYIWTWSSHGQVFTISIQEIVDETGLSAHQVRRGLSTLRKVDLIKSKRIGKGSSLLQIRPL